MLSVPDLTGPLRSSALHSSAALDAGVDTVQHRLGLSDVRDRVGHRDEVGVVVDEIAATVGLGTLHVVRVDLCACVGRQCECVYGMHLSCAYVWCMRCLCM